MDTKGIEACLRKVKYDTRENAAIAYQTYRKNMQRKRGKRVQKIKHEQRPYRCDYCNKWHLTRI